MNPRQLVAAEVALFVVVMAGAAAWDFATQPAGQAPDFHLTSTGFEQGMQGQPVNFSLQDYAGKTVLIDFMAVTCTSCRVLTQEVLHPLHAEFGNRSDFVLLSIDTWADPGSGQTFGGETVEDLIDLQKREGTPWRHALDTDQVYLKYSAISLPKIAVIDGNGIIVYEQAGIPPKSEVRAVLLDSFSGTASEANVLRLGLWGLAFAAGVASFFAPCSVGLIPAYLGLLLNGQQGANPAHRTRRTMTAGITTSLGVVSLYAVLAVVFAFIGTWVRPHLGTVQVVSGYLLVVLGLLMLRTGLWDGLASRLGMGKIDGRKGFFAFGFGFGLASFGCTGPIFLPVLLAGFATSTATGVGVFLVYGAALVALMMLAAALVASGRSDRLNRLLANTRTVSRTMAALFVLAGAWVVWFHYRAEGTWL